MTSAYPKEIVFVVNTDLVRQRIEKKKEIQNYAKGTVSQLAYSVKTAALYERRAEPNKDLCGFSEFCWCERPPSWPKNYGGLRGQTRTPCLLLTF